MPERKEKADRKGPPFVLHQLAHDIIDGRDMVGIEGVAQSERIGEDGSAHQHRPVGKADPSPKPGGYIGGDQDSVDDGSFASGVLRPIVEEINEQR